MGAQLRETQQDTEGGDALCFSIAYSPLTWLESLYIRPKYANSPPEDHLQGRQGRGRISLLMGALYTS